MAAVSVKHNSKNTAPEAIFEPKVKTKLLDASR